MRHNLLMIFLIDLIECVFIRSWLVRSQLREWWRQIILHVEFLMILQSFRHCDIRLVRVRWHTRMYCMMIICSQNVYVTTCQYETSTYESFFVPTMKKKKKKKKNLEITNIFVRWWMELYKWVDWRLDAMKTDGVTKFTSDLFRKFNRTEHFTFDYMYHFRCSTDAFLCVTRSFYFHSALSNIVL